VFIKKKLSDKYPVTISNSNFEIPVDDLLNGFSDSFSINFVAWNTGGEFSKEQMAHFHPWLTDVLAISQSVNSDFPDPGIPVIVVRSPGMNDINLSNDSIPIFTPSG
jgi:hypothetical protein